MVESVCNLVTHLGKGFNQLDINPVVYSGGRWLALDAKMILGEKPQW